MNLTKLTAKPQLIKVEINDEEIVSEFGEPIEFHILDRYPMKKFMRLANLKEEDYSEMIDLVQELVLDEKGKPFLNDENLLPTRIMTRVVSSVVERLGK